MLNIQSPPHDPPLLSHLSVPTGPVPTGPVPKGRMGWYCSLAILGLGADLFTKHLVFRHPQLYRGSEWWLWQ